jgi:glucokinase
MAPSSSPTDAHATQAAGAQDHLLLAGNLGATQATLGVISPTAGPSAPLVEATFPTNRYPSFTAIVQEFLAQVGTPVHRACFGMPGSVVSGRATLSTLPWLVDETVLAAALRLPSVRLLNDLEALAYAVPHLEAEDLVTLNPGVREAEGNLAVIAPVAGLGEAFLIWTGSGYRVCASEGGHADFAPADDLQIELLQHLRSRLDHVSYERVCSESGIQQIYDFLSLLGRSRPDGPELIAGIAEGKDPAPLIVDAALHAGDASVTSVAALDLFLSILGAEAGNLALKVLATGGVYLGGGVVLQMQSLLRNGRFMQAFRGKGRSSARVGRVPVQVVATAKAPLLGVAHFGLALTDTGRP